MPERVSDDRGKFGSAVHALAIPTSKMSFSYHGLISCFLKLAGYALPTSQLESLLDDIPLSINYHFHPF